MVVAGLDLFPDVICLCAFEQLLSTYFATEVIDRSVLLPTGQMSWRFSFLVPPTDIFLTRLFHFFSHKWEDLDKHPGKEETSFGVFFSSFKRLPLERHEHNRFPPAVKVLYFFFLPHFILHEKN